MLRKGMLIVVTLLGLHNGVGSSIANSAIAAALLDALGKFKLLLTLWILLLLVPLFFAPAVAAAALKITCSCDTRHSHSILFMRMRVVLLAALLAVGAAQPSLSSTISPTRSSSKTMSATRSASPSPTPLCPPSSCTPYTFTARSYEQTWVVPLTPTYSYLFVNLWGAGGGYQSDTFYNYGGGAFMSGAIAVVPGETLRIIVGGFNGLSAFLGCAGKSEASYGGNYAGGRSAIQRLLNGNMTDILTAGGGGGSRGAPPYGYYLAYSAGFSTSDGTTCIRGVRNCGNNGSLGMGIASGGGWCGGVTGGGGSSFNATYLFCAYRANPYFNTSQYTPLPGGNAGKVNNDGLVIISAMPQTWQPCDTILPSVPDSPTISISGTITPTPSRSKNSNSVTPTFGTSNTRTPSSSKTSSLTPTKAGSVSATRSAQLTQSLTSSPSSTPPSISLGASASITATPTTTITPTGSNSDSQTSLITPSFTVTPPQTPSATVTPPPFSCLSRSEGCSYPSFVLGWPVTTSGISTSSSGSGSGTPLAAVAAFPVIRTPFTIVLPSTPANSETLTITCASTSFIIVLAAASMPFRCSVAVSTRAACLQITASSPLIASFFLVASSPLSAADDITCTVASTAIIGGALPRYGLVTNLTKRALSLPTSWPLIGAVLIESRAVAGVFSSIAGTALGTSWTLTPANITSIDATAAASSVSCALLLSASMNSTWRMSTLPFCSPALTVITSLAAAAAAVSAPPSLSFSVSGSAHMLLVAPLGGPPLSSTLTATLGGVAVSVNWIAPDGSVASITTPSLTALCTALNAPVGATDCGLVQLVISSGLSASWTTTANKLTTAATSGSVQPDVTLFFKTAFPPLLANSDWQGITTTAMKDAIFLSTGALSNAQLPFGVLATLVGADSTAALAAAAALTPSGVGIRALTECLGFSPTYLCAQAAFSKQTNNNNNNNLLCAWGSGDNCALCATGALCPGGNVLLPLPGFWAPLSSSTPDQLVQCPAPDAVKRCPGYFNLSASASGVYGCGVGFRGPACGGCARGFFASAQSCTLCPVVSGDVQLQAFAPFFIFAVCLGLVGALLIGLAISLLGVKARTATLSVAELASFFWSAAQSASASFSVVQAFAPTSIAPYFSVLASLQFVGFVTPPSCYDAPPYLSLWLCVAAIASITIIGAIALISIVRARRSSRTSLIANGALSFAAGLFAFVLGAAVSELVKDMPCSASQTMGVRAYFALVQDGTTITTALGDSDSPLSRALAGTAVTLADLSRAAIDPVFASAQRLTAALDVSVSVKLVLSDPFTVCGEGEHGRALIGGAVAFAMLCAILLLQFWAAGGITLLRNLSSSSKSTEVVSSKLATPEETGEKDDPTALEGSLTPNALSSSHIIATALTAANTPTDVSISRASFLPAQSSLTTLVSALTSLASAQTILIRFCALMGVSVVAQLAFATLTLFVAPFTGAGEWKTRATVILLGLGTFSNAIAISFWFQNVSGSASENLVRAAFALFIVAIISPLLMIFAWFVTLNTTSGATRHPAWISKLPALFSMKSIAISQGSSTVSEAESFVANPLVKANDDALRLGPSFYTRQREGSSEWYVNDSTGESVWILPSYGIVRQATIVQPSSPLRVSSTRLKRLASGGSLLRRPSPMRVLSVRLRPRHKSRIAAVKTSGVTSTLNPLTLTVGNAKWVAVEDGGEHFFRNIETNELLWHIPEERRPEVRPEVKRYFYEQQDGEDVWFFEASTGISTWTLPHDGTVIPSTTIPQPSPPAQDSLSQLNSSAASATLYAKESCTPRTEPCSTVTDVLTLSQLKIKRAWTSYRLRVFRRSWFVVRAFNGDVFLKNKITHKLEWDLPPPPTMTLADVRKTTTG